MNGYSAVWIAVIASVLSPMVLLLRDGAQRKEARKDKQLEWARQDAVVKQTDAKLDELHKLGNSQLDRAYRAELDSAEAYLAVLLELKALKGGEPTVEALAVIRSTEVKINELKTTLAERAKEAAVRTEHSKQKS